MQSVKEKEGKNSGARMVGHFGLRRRVAAFKARTCPRTPKSTRLVAPGGFVVKSAPGVCRSFKVSQGQSRPIKANQGYSSSFNPIQGFSGKNIFLFFMRPTKNLQPATCNFIHP
jgi:hypothetical protein